MDMLIGLKHEFIDNARRYPNVLRVHPRIAREYGAVTGDMVLGMRVVDEPYAPYGMAYLGYEDEPAEAWKPE
jgi:hypothetical protein